MELPIDNIVIRERSRTEMRNIESLANSIRETGGPLHPPVVRLDNGQYVLVAGARRLAAMRLLGYDRVTVNVAVSLIDELAALRAEGEENTEREPFLPSEAVAHAKRIEGVIAAKAKERQRTQNNVETASADSAEAVSGERETRTQVAKAVGMGRTALTEAATVVATAADDTLPAEVRQTAVEAVKEMDSTGKVNGPYKKVKAALDWAGAVQQFPFLDGIPEPKRNDFLAGARQLSTMVGRERERSLAAFEAHAVAAKRPRDHARDEEAKSRDRSRQAVSDLSMALARIPQLVNVALDWPDELHAYPDISGTWADQIDACTKAFNRLAAAIEPQPLRRIK